MRRLIWPASFRFLLALGVVAGLDSGCSKSPNGPSTPPTPTSLLLGPRGVTVQTGVALKFSVLVMGRYSGHPDGPPALISTLDGQYFAWSVAGTGCFGASCGTIDATGRYTAPATVPDPPIVTITASPLVASPLVDFPNSLEATVTLSPPQSFSINQTSVLFGNQMVHTTSAPIAVTVTNTGGTLQQVHSRFNAGNVADFAQTNDCPSMLAVGASCTFNVTFTPSATGGRGALMIFDGVFDEEGYVNVGGTGIN